MRATSFVGDAEGIAAAQEVTATTPRQADAVEVVLDRVRTRQAQPLQVLGTEDAQAAVRHRGHQVIDLQRRAVALKIIAQVFADLAQFLAQLLARRGRGTHPDHPVQAHRTCDHPHVAGRQQQHAGAVADRVIAHPDGPVVLADRVTGANRRFHVATGGIEVEDALADAKVGRHLAHALGQRGETGGHLALVAQADQAGAAAVLHGVAQVHIGQRQHRLAIALAVIGAAVDPGIAGFQPFR